MKTNKKVIGIFSLALIVIIGVASLAYFTDSVTNDISLTSGRIELKDDTISLSKEIMVPGDTLELPIKATSVGKNTAKVRLRIINHVDNAGLGVFKGAGATEGFVVQKDEVSVDITGNGYVEEVKSIVKPNEPITFTGLRAKLLENSGNEYQDQVTKLTYVIEAMQDGHTEWAQVDGGEITIKTQH